MKKTLSLLTALAVMIALMTGCAKPPQQDIDTANQAVEAAKAAEADKYAAEQFTSVKETLDAAMADIEAQNGKKLGRDYSKAKALLQTVVAAANAVRETAVAGKEKVETEAETAVGQARAAIAEVTALAKKAKGKEAKAAQADIKALEAEVAAAANLVKEDFMVAADKARALVDKATALKERLTPKKAEAKKKKK